MQITGSLARESSLHLLDIVDAHIIPDIANIVLEYIPSIRHCALCGEPSYMPRLFYYLFPLMSMSRVCYSCSDMSQYETVLIDNKEACIPEDHEWTDKFVSKFSDEIAVFPYFPRRYSLVAIREAIHTGVLFGKPVDFELLTQIVMPFMCKMHNSIDFKNMVSYSPLNVRFKLPSYPVDRLFSGKVCWIQKTKTFIVTWFLESAEFEDDDGGDKLIAHDGDESDDPGSPVLDMVLTNKRKRGEDEEE